MGWYHHQYSMVGMVLAYPTKSGISVCDEKQGKCEYVFKEVRHDFK
jgi:hypothetical protein